MEGGYSLLPRRRVHPQTMYIILTSPVQQRSRSHKISVCNGNNYRDITSFSWILCTVNWAATSPVATKSVDIHSATIVIARNKTQSRETEILFYTGRCTRDLHSVSQTRTIVRTRAYLGWFTNPNSEMNSFTITCKWFIALQISRRVLRTCCRMTTNYQSQLLLSQAVTPILHQFNFT